jgi:hypothetical protein
MADGSARRGPKAPGYDDHRAQAVDRTFDEALRAGDAEPFRKLAPDVADDLLIGGHYSDDPFGVWYPVYVWTPM